jgi:NAD(P)H-nitrite reductase large subunit
MKSASARYVVIGNSTAAVGAVEAIRRADPEGSLILLSREARHTYSRPLISYLLAREITPERMYYRPQDFYEKNRVDARLGVSALAVDSARRLVRTSDGGEIAFTTLLVASGGRPFVPDMPGKDSKGVFTFTSWDDAEALDAWISSGCCGRAVVIGGGLIGLKAAEALRARGLAVTIVELAEKILPLALDETASRMARRSLENAGIEVLCSETVSRIESESGSSARGG